LQNSKVSQCQSDTIFNELETITKHRFFLSLCRKKTYKTVILTGTDFAFFLATIYFSQGDL
jgi:hypothetical protein